MVKNVDRRAVLGGLAAAGVTLGCARAQNLVMRPPGSGTDPRYIRYSQAGPYSGGDNQRVFTIPDLGFRAAVHVPRAAEASLVVFSHGALADPQVYRPLLSHWTSHGFAVVAPIHDDSAIERGLSARREDPHTGTHWELSRLLGDPESWQLRTNMCSDILNATEVISKLTGCRLLTKQPIIAGHSHGAYCAQLIMGASAQVGDGKTLTATDSRFAGGMFLSPQGEGIMGLTETSWAGLDRPGLSVIAGHEIDTNGQGVNDKMSAFQRSTAPYQHLAVERDGDRDMFTGQVTATTQDQQMRFDDLKAVTTAFLLGYVRHEEAAFGDLYGQWMSIATSNRMMMASR
ncbi:hypothetical protein ACVIGB_000384 [Bradyrhizobium sp. USDA 4341]